MIYNIEYTKNGETLTMSVQANSLESATRYVNERTKVRFDGYTPKSKELELVVEVEAELVEEEPEEELFEEDDE